jgi:protein phosphatase 4 regulatory subunit 3
VDEEILNNAKRPQPQPQQRPITISLQPNEGSSSANGQPDSPKVANGVLPHAETASSPSSSSQPAPYSFAPPEESLNEEQIAHRREVIFLIQQLCIMGKNVQLPARMALFRNLVDRGVLFAVQWALSRSEKDIVSKPVIGAGGEILSALLDHDVNGVRGHVLKQVVAIEKERLAGKRGADKAETIMELCCKLMAQSKEMAIQNQVGDALRVWLDLPPGGEMLAAMGTEASQVRGDYIYVIYNLTFFTFPLLLGVSVETGTER